MRCLPRARRAGDVPAADAAHRSPDRSVWSIPWQAQKRAKHHKDRQSGESISAKVHLQSWFDDGGMIWQANALVFIESPKLKLSNMMLIKSVHLSQSENGSFTDLDLVMPEAFGGDGGGMGGSAGSGSNTSPQWG